MNQNTRTQEAIERLRYVADQCRRYADDVNTDPGVDSYLSGYADGIEAAILRITSTMTDGGS